MPESERNKVAIGASGLVLGLVLALAGLIYYKRKANGEGHLGMITETICKKPSVYCMLY